MKREIAQGNIWFGRGGKNAPRVKKFLSDAKVGLTPETIWPAEEVGTSDETKKQLKVLFPEEDKVFETPKPEGLLERIIAIASNKGDYVLDCFLGSGTTVAVAHKMGRRYIGIEVGDQISRLVFPFGNEGPQLRSERLKPRRRVRGTHGSLYLRTIPALHLYKTGGFQKEFDRHYGKKGGICQVNSENEGRGNGE